MTSARHLRAGLLGLLTVLGARPACAVEPIRIGIVGPVTGPAANTGLTVRATWDLVAKRINEKGGLLVDGERRTIELVGADSQSKPSVGVSAAQRLLVRDKVDLLVGDTLHSDVTLAMMELASSFPDKILYVPLPTSASIADRIENAPEKYGNVWKWDADSTAYGTSIADHLRGVAASGQRPYANKTYAFVSEMTDYSSTILAATRKELESSGWKLVTNETVPLGSTDFYAQISKVRSLAPDVVISIFTTANTGLAYIRQTKEQNAKFDNVAVYYPGLPAFAEGIGENANGLVFFSGSFDATSERGKAFSKLMAESKINASGDAILGYCSAVVLFQSIERAQSVRRAELEKALAATDDDTCPNYQRVVFDPRRHAPKLGPDFSFMPGGQMYDNGKSFFIFYPARAATRKLDDIPRN